MGLIAFVFPGQGAQKVAMGKELVAAFPTAKAVFEEADQALGYSISRLCFEGPEADLQLTANAQPALLTVSVAILRVLQEETGLSPDLVAGHSLGEYSALVAAGVLSFADAVRLVHKRGLFMQEAVPAGHGGMAAIMGIAQDAVEKLCTEAAQSQVLRPANFNGGGQIVIAGHAEAVARAEALGKERGAVVRPLKVSAPFHCPLMEPAAGRLREEIDKVSFADAKIPVITNVDASANLAGGAAKTLLVRQVIAPVRWEESVRQMVAMGTYVFFEIGVGTTLVSMVRRIDSRFQLKEMGDLSAIDDLHQLAAIETPQHIAGLKQRVFHDLERHVAPLGYWRIANDGSKIARDQSRAIWPNNAKETIDAERWHLNANGTKTRKYGTMHIVWPDGTLEGMSDSEWTWRADGAFVKKDHSRIITSLGEVQDFDVAEWEIEADGTMKKKDGTHIIWADGLEWDSQDTSAQGS